MVSEQDSVSKARAEALGRIAKVIAELPAIGKDRKNEAQRYTFRGIDDIMAALKPLLGKHGIIIVPNVLERLVDTRALRNGGSLYFTYLRVRYDIYVPEGLAFSAEVWGEGSDSGDKSTNKAMTAAYKYLVNQVFCIADASTEDGDAQSPEVGDAPKPKPKSASKKKPVKPPMDPEKASDLHRAENLAQARALLTARYGNAHVIQNFLTKKFGDDYQGDMSSLSSEQVSELILELADE